MEDICPKCGTTLTTRTIKKQLGLGSIDYPVAQVCPKCNWSRDLTGAGDIVAKPLVVEGGRIVEEEKPEVAEPAWVEKAPVKKAPVEKAHVKRQPALATSPADMNKVITAVLAILVLGGIIWAFMPSGQLEPAKAPEPTPTPEITATPVVTATTTMEVTPTGNKAFIQLDRYRIYRGANPNIKPGDEIVWINEGVDRFTLASDNIPDFKEIALDNGKQTSYIFKNPGTYSFYIKENKDLSGTIVVKS